MATQAEILINSVAGSNTDLPLNTLVNLSNNGAGGETTWEWTLISQPLGTQVNFDDSGTLVSTLAAPQFTPTKEGSYLIRLIVNKGLVDEKTDTVIGAVLELQTGNRIPAALETTEVNSTYGWAYTAVNDILQRVTRLTDAGTFVCIAGENLAPGDVVHMTEMTVIAAGLPGQRYLPTVMKANASSLGEVDGPLAVMVGQRDGDFLAVTTGEYCRVMTMGGLSQISLAGSSGGVGAPVYVDDAGALSLTPGTYIRQVGDVAKVYAGPVYDVAIAAVANSIPRGNAGGDLTGFYPDPTIATGAVTAAKLATSAVEEAKIAAGAVTETKLGANAVTNTKIAAGAVTADKVSSTFFFSGTATLTSTTSTTYVTVLTISSVVMPGTLLHIATQPFGASPYVFRAANSSGTDHAAYVQVTMTGPTTRTYQYEFFANKSASINIPPIHITDTCSPGTYTITLQARVSDPSVTVSWDQLSLVAFQP